MSNPPPSPSRRTFLVRTAQTAGACLLVCAGCSAGPSPDNVGTLSAGNVSELPVGSLKALSGEPVCIGRDAGGVYAMTLTCTHQGCTADVSGAAIVCPCHGSEFDADGNVVRGPASTALAHFAVSADAQGNLSVDTGTTVPASTRLVA